MRFNESRMNKALLKSMLNESAEDYVDYEELLDKLQAVLNDVSSNFVGRKEIETAIKAIKGHLAKAAGSEKSKPNYRQFDDYEEYKRTKELKYKGFDIAIHTVRKYDYEDSYTEYDVVVTKDGKIPEGFKDWYPASEYDAGTVAEATKLAKEIVDNGGDLD